MARLQKHSIATGSTSGAGAVTAYSPLITGRLVSVRYIKTAGGTAFANGVDFAITGEDSAQGIWTEQNIDASTIRYPLTQGADSVGVAIAAAYGPVYLVNERVKFAITNGGDTKNGTFELVVDVS